MNRTVVGVNIAKKVFQVHYIDPATGEIAARVKVDVASVMQPMAVYRPTRNAF